MTRLNTARVGAVLEQGLRRVLLVDVRSREEYLARHIRGAVSIPLDEIVARASEVPQEGLVVLY